MPRPVPFAPWSILALFVLLLPPGRAAQRATPGLAPDGQPGLLREGSQSDFLRPFRSRDEHDLALLGGLRAVGSDVRLLAANALQGYRSAGYLALVAGTGEQDLADLHAAWNALREDPLAVLSGPDRERARGFARMALDERFIVRAELLSSFELEAAEVEAGLAVLEGSAQSYVQLTDAELRAVATRVDLAASRLRALRSDLQALRSRPRAGRVEPGDGPRVEALLSAARAEDRAVARAAVADALAEARARADLMKRALFSARLEGRVLGLLDWRRSVLVEAAALRAQALVALPGGVPLDEVPAELLAMRKPDRLRLAGMRARQGLAADPLDAELAYVAAQAADFQWGSLESLPLYDRYLHLRGIRHHDHRSMKGRRLTEREQTALNVVQGLGDPTRRPPPRPRDD